MPSNHLLVFLSYVHSNETDLPKVGEDILVKALLLGASIYILLFSGSFFTNMVASRYLGTQLTELSASLTYASWEFWEYYPSIHIRHLMRKDRLACVRCEFWMIIVLAPDYYLKRPFGSGF